MLLIICLINWFVTVIANQKKPTLQEILLPKKLIENQGIKLNCDLIDGTKPIKFIWYFNDQILNEKDKNQIIHRDDMSSLMIKELSIEEIGTYKCVAINNFGDDSQKVTIQVNSKYKNVCIVKIINFYFYFF